MDRYEIARGLVPEAPVPEDSPSQCEEHDQIARLTWLAKHDKNNLRPETIRQFDSAQVYRLWQQGALQLREDIYMAHNDPTRSPRPQDLHRPTVTTAAVSYWPPDAGVNGMYRTAYPATWPWTV